MRFSSARNAPPAAQVAIGLFFMLVGGVMLLLMMQKPEGAVERTATVVSRECRTSGSGDRRSTSCQIDVRINDAAVPVGATAGSGATQTPGATPAVANSGATPPSTVAPGPTTAVPGATPPAQASPLQAQGEIKNLRTTSSGMRIGDQLDVWYSPTEDWVQLRGFTWMFAFTLVFPLIGLVVAGNGMRRVLTGA